MEKSSPGHWRQEASRNVLNEAVAKTRPAERLRKLTTVHRTGRVQLALAGAREAVFDWTMADDRIAWDGAQNLLAVHRDPERLCEGEHFRPWMGEAGSA